MGKINVTRSSMPDFEEYIEEIKDLWDTHWLTNMGKKHNELAERLKEFLGVKNVTLYTNGHLALEGILQAMKFSFGGEVITTPFTFVSTTHAIVRTGLKPVFCDIRPDNYCIDENKIESLITDKTVAILPVHVYGNMCNVEVIEKIAKKHNLKVIYDAAHAFAVEYKGKSSACYGDAVMYSFHATKVFNTIEGGAVCYNNDELIEVLNNLKNFGIKGAESCVYVGGNAKMNEFQASMGICNLRHLKEEIGKREKVAREYVKRLSGIKGIKLLKDDKDTKSNYAYFPVIFDGYKYSRDDIYEKLLKIDVVSRKYFYPLVSDLECYKGRDFADSNKTPVAKEIASKVLTLPLFADLDLKMVNTICDIILD